MKEEFLNLSHPVFVDKIDWVIQYKECDFWPDEYVQYVNKRSIEILRSKDTSPEMKGKLLRELYQEKNNLALI